MTRRRDLNRREYSLSWQSEFARRARLSGEAAVRLARRSISMWRAMSRRASIGHAPSELDYRQIGADPERFLLMRAKQKLNKALRLGLAQEVMERRGLFDPLRHHQAYRAFKIVRAPDRCRRAIPK